MSNDFAPLHVEIWSDIACPWCFVGKRRFEAALAGFEHRDHVRVTWRSFELDPEAPAERPQDAATHLAEKYRTSPEQARSMIQQMTDVAAQDGLAFRFDLQRGGSTFDAHRLVHLGLVHGRQDEVKERMLRAYLEEGALMSDRDTLQRLGEEAGLPADAVREVLASERYAEDVRDDERTAAQLGVHAVPFFVVDRRIAASGAQPPEVLGELLRQAWAAREPAIPVVAGGDACGPEGC